MVGQIPQCGTGDSEIILDEDKIKEYYSKKTDIKTETKPVDINEIFNNEDLIINDMFDINNIDGDNINL